MGNLIYGMNVSLDGYIADTEGDISWGVSTEELFRWWLEEEQAVSLMLYGRKLWETMSSYWPTGDRSPDARPDQVDYARNWRDTPKIVFASDNLPLDWNTRLATGDAVAEIRTLKEQVNGSIRIGGASLASAAMRAGLIDEYTVVTHPVLLGGGNPFFCLLDQHMHLELVETRVFDGGVTMNRYRSAT